MNRKIGLKTLGESMTDNDLTLKIGEQTELDKVVNEVMSKPITEEELKGFGRQKSKPRDTRPYFKFKCPSREDGPKGYSIEIGIKGKF